MVLLLLSSALVLAVAACDIRRAQQTEEQDAGESITAVTDADEGVDEPEDASAEEEGDGGVAGAADVDLAGITTQDEARRKLAELGVEYGVEQFLDQLRKAN